MTKEKLFIWCDSPTVATGFGIVAKNLFSELHQHFEVYILGINYYGTERYDTSKYFIYPVAEGKDALGLTRFKRVLKDVNPDKILLFQDIFNIQHVLEMIKKDFPKVPILAYFPIDASTVNQYWRAGFDTPNKLVTYTQFAVDSIKNTFPHLANTQIDYLYHGVDTRVFKKLPTDIRKRFKEDRGWGNKFVVFSNNRFQPRKNMGATVRAFTLFFKGYKKCDCGNIYLISKTHCDLNGCDASHVVHQQKGHDDVYMYMHCNVFESTMGQGPANSLAGVLTNAGLKQEDLPEHVGMYSKSVYDAPYTDSEMNILYNVSDVNISTSLGEGVGLSLIEAAAVGTTSIAPKHTAIPEMLGDTGHLIKNAAHFVMGQDNSSSRPLVDIAGVVDALEAEYQKWVANGKKKVVNEEAIERVNKLFLWDDKRKLMTDWLKSL